MLRNLLICGLIAGVCAGLVAMGMATAVGEPHVDAAIAFEEANAPAQQPGAPPDEALVSRDAQKSFGLLTAVIVYGLSIGGLFALVFAVVYGRVAKNSSPARTALWLAAIGFVVVFLVPFLKYPANPPATGAEATIGDRTALYFTMMWISVFAAVAAVRLRRLLVGRPGFDTVLATGLGVVAYVAAVAIAGIALPGVSELPEGFSAATLWNFRLASVAIQASLWTTIAVVFAYASQRVMNGLPIVPKRNRDRLSATTSP